MAEQGVDAAEVSWEEGSWYCYCVLRKVIRKRLRRGIPLKVEEDERPFFFFFQLSDGGG